MERGGSCINALEIAFLQFTILNSYKTPLSILLFFCVLNNMLIFDPAQSMLPRI